MRSRSQAKNLGCGFLQEYFVYLRKSHKIRREIIRQML